MWTEYQVQLKDEMEDRLRLKKYYTSKEFLENFIYGGNDLGVKCSEDGTSFRLWAPQAEGVSLNLYEKGEGGGAYLNLPMKKEDKGVWSFDTIIKSKGMERKSFPQTRMLKLAV